ncbi:unnamed protein product [Acanthosepion pharaonis]|uniref:Uncharacterized protein n=1 Tax=Acanthosepion pharaonis TaxID=158019 RepID=A0A812CV72_ACAPH|nr:unnamed protein product [Sepia pharaonis]
MGVNFFVQQNAFSPSCLSFFFPSRLVFTFLSSLLAFFLPFCLFFNTCMISLSFLSGLYFFPFLIHFFFYPLLYFFTPSLSNNNFQAPANLFLFFLLSFFPHFSHFRIDSLHSLLPSISLPLFLTEFNLSLLFYLVLSLSPFSILLLTIFIHCS